MDLRDTIRTYRLFSGSYDIVFGPVFHPGRKEAVRLANDRPGQRILEVGVGTGLSLPYFRSDSQITGIDISAEMLEKARRRVERKQLRNVDGAACHGRREPRIRGQLVRLGAGAVCRLGGAEPGPLRRRDAPRLHSRRHDRPGQPFHERELGAALHGAAPGASRPPYRFPRRFPARQFPRGKPARGARDPAEQSVRLLAAAALHQRKAGLQPALRARKGGYGGNRRHTALAPGIDIRKMTDRLAAIAETVRRDGYAFVRAPEMRALLEAAGLRDWDGFAASWDDLGVDTYMADGGRYRRRRFACFRATPRGDRAQAASAALPEPRLQPAERRDRALVRAGDRADRRASGDARHPDDVPGAVRPADPGGHAPPGLACRDTPVPHRSAAGAERATDPRGHAPRRRRLGAGAARQPGQYRERRHDDRRSGRNRRSAALRFPIRSTPP